MEDAQIPEKRHTDRALVLMAVLCLVAGLIAYFLVRQSLPYSDAGILTEETQEPLFVDTMQGVSAAESQPTEPQDDISALRDELTSFDLELTDVMAPLPMEGVEPAGSTGNQ